MAFSASMNSVRVTGAGGFVGRALVSRLRQAPQPPRLTLLDTGGLEGWLGQPGVTCITGSIGERDGLAAAVAQARPDLVFHLASIPGGAAERDYPLGRAINLDATVNLLELLAEVRDPARTPPVLVFASSIAVFGGPLPDPVQEDHPPSPLLSYGAQKLMGEVAVADFARRGWVDGRSLRLPGIVTRPPPPAGMRAGAVSVFLSDLLRDLPRGLPVTVPMSPTATTWLMSCACAVSNLLHAARMTPPLVPACVWTPPVLRVAMAELVEAIGAHAGRDVSHFVRYAPDPAVEAAFGASPLLHSRRSEAAGFRHDGDLGALIRAAGASI